MIRLYRSALFSLVLVQSFIFAYQNHGVAQPLLRASGDGCVFCPPEERGICYDVPCHPYNAIFTGNTDNSDGRSRFNLLWIANEVMQRVVNE